MTQNKNDRPKGYIDYTLIFILILLLGFGLVMVYSTSSYSASISKASNNDPNFYLRKQAIATVFGAIAMAGMAIIPYHFWERYGALAYLVAGILVLLVLTPLGMELNGARRWLNLGVSVQPAEIAKLAMILFLAAFVNRMGQGIRSRRGFWVVLGAPIPMCLLVWKITDNLSSAIIIFGISFLMLFVASPEYKKFVAFMATVAIGAGLVVFMIVQMSNSALFGFRGARVRAWLNPEEYSSSTGYQTLQALYAIGSGGTFGKGLGQSTQKLGFIPEAQNDMIFSIICEELGLFGGLAILVMFLMLLFRILDIAQHTQNEYDNLLLTGIFAHLALQVIMNVAVVTGLMPNTGISLPFISQGGTSVVFLCVEIGIVMRIARNCSFEPQKKVKVKKLKNEEKES